MTNKLPAFGLALAGILIQSGCEKTAVPAGETTPAPGKAAESGVAAAIRKILPAKPVILPEGTALAVRTTTALSTNSHVAGQTFIGHLERPLLLDGREIAPSGAEVEGTVVESDKGGRVKGRARLAVQLTRLHTAGGQVVEISTNSVSRLARATKKEDAAKIGIGGGVGAAIGAIAGGGKGAAIGAAAGAGAGTGVVLGTRGKPAVIGSETLLNFALRAPATVAAK
jgi:hypothetical protein